MSEVKCLKNKNLDKCHSQKCSTFNRYNDIGLPCPYYIPPNKERGFSESLNQISGTRIRRMYFTFWIYMYSLCLVLVIITMALHEKSILLFFQFLFECIQYIVVFIVPFIILSLLNKRLFGRLVCIVNENGLYCNQKLLQWSQIKSATYDIDLPGKSRSGYCSVKIGYDRGYSLIIPHAPRSILKQIKKYCPQSKLGFSTNSKVWIGMFVGITIFLPIITVLTEGR